MSSIDKLISDVQSFDFPRAKDRKTVRRLVADLIGLKNAEQMKDFKEYKALGVFVRKVSKDKAMVLAAIKGMEKYKEHVKKVHDKGRTLERGSLQSFKTGMKDFTINVDNLELKREQEEMEKLIGKLSIE